MIGPILALVLASDPGGAADATPPAPPGAPAPRSAVAEARDNLARAEQLYTQSCADRAYASYDDICSQLSDQVHDYHVAFDRLVRDEAKKRTAAPKR